jgi:hypothetical protein
MIETKKLPRVLPLPCFLPQAGAAVVICLFPLRFIPPFTPASRHSLRVHVIVPVIGPVSCPLVSPSIPFMSMLLYPSLVVSLSVSPPSTLRAVAHSSGGGYWFVVGPGGQPFPCRCSLLLPYKADARSSSLLLLVGGSMGVGALVG